MTVQLRLTTALADRYRVERELGAGGMATVYLAHDLKHERDVAIKVLHPDLGAVLGGDRFLAEIKTTAKLQHPHILPLLDSGVADGLLYYVMPFVEGETLRARLDRETQLPIADAMMLVREVADALQHAHERGVIHRDIKPENILLQSGHALVADFGIALAVQQSGGARMTQTGLSLGTPQYMAPEQAMGERTVDARADVYALGAVTYEMLTGEPPFTGPTSQAIVARVLTATPAAIRETRPTVAEHVEAAVLTALAKLPADRPASVREFVAMLSAANTVATAVAGASLAPPAKGRERTPLLLSVAFALASIAATWGWLRPADGSTNATSARFTIALRDSVPLVLGGGTDTRWERPSSRSVLITPDGQAVVFAAHRAGDPNARSRLYRRALDDERIVPIAGTEGATAPFLSPDGAHVGFFVGRELRRMPLSGGESRIVAELSDSAPARSGAVWTSDGHIVFGQFRRLSRVSADGGAPQILIPGDSVGGGLLQRLQVTAASKDGRLLFHKQITDDERSAELSWFDPATGTTTTLLKDAMDGRIIGDTIVYFMRRTTLLRQRIDAKAGRLLGTAEVIRESIAQAIGMPNDGIRTGIAHFDVAPNGNMVLALGGAFPLVRAQLLRISPDGRQQRLPIPPVHVLSLRVSPDGKLIAFGGRRDSTSGRYSVTLYEIARNVLSPLPYRGSGYFPIWSPDGRRVALAGTDGQGTVIVPVAAGSEVITVSNPVRNDGRMSDWATDGRKIFAGNPAYVIAEKTSPSTWGRGRIRFPTFSPDGKYIAAVENDQVIIRTSADTGETITVSEVGGHSPAWSPSGDRLYWTERDTVGLAVKMVEVSYGGGVRVSLPRTLASALSLYNATPVRAYDVAPDGSLILPVGNVAEGANSTMPRISELHVEINAVRRR